MTRVNSKIKIDRKTQDILQMGEPLLMQMHNSPYLRASKRKYFVAPSSAFFLSSINAFFSLSNYAKRQ
jgi:hypothetical protein